MKKTETQIPQTSVPFLAWALASRFDRDSEALDPAFVRAFTVDDAALRESPDEEKWRLMDAAIEAELAIYAARAEAGDAFAHKMFSRPLDVLNADSVDHLGNLKALIGGAGFWVGFALASRLLIERDGVR